MRGLRTVPNLLTLLRLLLIPVFLLASFRGMFTTAFILFLTAAVTDILDGIIARWLNQKSRIGAILDPAADKTMMIFGYLYYTLAGNLTLRIPGWLTFTVFVRDFLIIMFAYLLYTRVQVKRFPPSWAGKISTLLQAAALGAVIGVNAAIPKVIWLAEPLFRLALLMTLFSGGDYIRRAKKMLVVSAAA
ncbi:MAG TPA: CDP-alcohol phosphatidyltransferase family protein [Thermoanaerobaculia bacterium]|nr:CDP-alcohol phosphatidyltransferase family protein [Thermoanaerobaculia bacterium]